MGFCKFSMYNFLYLVIVVLFGVFGEQNSQLMNDKVALLSFMSEIVSDPGNVLENWNSSDVHVCNWARVSCNNASDSVTELILNATWLSGTISPSLANLSSLTILDLSMNFFEGPIPKELGSLTQLKQLSLSWNFLEGKIPYHLGFLHKMVYLDLGSNKLQGEIPESLFCNGSLSLRYIDLTNNSLSGEIPFKNECGLENLSFLLLWSNRLVGHIPRALSNSTQLQWLDLESNMLTGELPSEIVLEMPRLQILYLSYNSFVSHHGNNNLEPFFASLVNCSDLKELKLAGNNLGGEIPPIVGDLSTNLLRLILSENLIHGFIPPHISNLANLNLLNLSSNLLNGSIPPELCRMGKLERVYLSNNSLSGEIPPVLGYVPHLGLLDLSRNKLSGPIPNSFANLPQLRSLILYQNQLTGTIPPSLGQCVNLEILDLSHNKISGVIPSEVAGLRSLKLYLNLSSNHLYGPLPLELSKMDMVLAIDLSYNNLIGTIPTQLKSCTALESLNLSHNFLEGPFPFSIGQLPYLQTLDVTSNQLIGEIPQSLQMSSSLKHVNFSFNKISGKVSIEGAFSLLTIDSFLGNDGLCGSIEGMPKCSNRHSHLMLILSVLLSLFSILILCIFGYCLVQKSRIQSQLEIFNGGDLDLKHPRIVRINLISYGQLNEATGGFSASSLIGSGLFGHVYKGVLRDNTRIAVKVLDTKMARESPWSFKRECQVLKRARHRNLIRIITICSRPDFKALVLPLMSNGSLERHLYPSHGLKRGLDLIQLVSICSDVAEGVAYLHHHSPVKVVHCDLKPSNILLDDDLTALVTDFGIARLVKGGDESANVKETISIYSTSGLLCGSVGYIAPEYGLGRSPSPKGDVYSFGVLLLEIVTGRRPTEVLIDEGSSLHEWVKSHFPHKLDPIVEHALDRCTPSVMPKEYTKIWRDVILEMIELGLMCTQFTPSTRPTMPDVAHEMGRLKDYLSNTSSSLPIEEVPLKTDGV
ncbi:putative leucine-rich repeat receptor-like serine/threonine-protein kinase At2g24130 [Quercus lobata]|nr:putative leucine-rich repeat receptor-like serine/threonine-protein kinase At2g24130 [Quercus lobata]